MSTTSFAYPSENSGNEFSKHFSFKISAPALFIIKNGGDVLRILKIREGNQLYS